MADSTVELTPDNIPVNIGFWKLAETRKHADHYEAEYHFASQIIELRFGLTVHPDVFRTFFNAPAMFSTGGCKDCGGKTEHSHKH